MSGCVQGTKHNWWQGPFVQDLREELVFSVEDFARYIGMKKKSLLDIETRDPGQHIGTYEVTMKKIIAADRCREIIRILKENGCWSEGRSSRMHRILRADENKDMEAAIKEIVSPINWEDFDSTVNPDIWKDLLREAKDRHKHKHHPWIGRRLNRRKAAKLYPDDQPQREKVQAPRKKVQPLRKKRRQHIRRKPIRMWNDGRSVEERHSEALDRIEVAVVEHLEPGGDHEERADLIRRLCVELNAADLPTVTGMIWEPSNMRRVINEYIRHFAILRRSTTPAEDGNFSD